MTSTPRDENREPGLIAKSDADNTPVVLEADAATKRLKVSAVITSGGSAGAQYTDGDAAIAHPIGTIPVYNNAGTITAVSVANPLPVSATISTAGLATSTKQSDGSQKTQIVDGSGNVVGSTGNALDVNVKTSATQVSTVSTNNSSAVVLAGNAIFTGTGDDCIAYSEIRITIIASHASATDGLSIQQSSDNSNWDITDTYTIAAATGKTFVVPRQARYLRVVYTNGATLQTSFRLQTILNRTGTTPSSQRSQDAYTNETDLQETWAFNSVWNGTTWDRLPGSTTGVTVKNATAANLNATVVGTGTFVVQATLSAETTKVIGTVNVAAGQTIAVTNAGTFASQATLQTQTDTVMVGGVNVKEINGVAPLMGVGATGTGASRIVVANDTGRTLLSKGGSASSSGDNTLVIAGTNRLKVYAFTLSTVSATAITCIFQSGASGTELWRVVLQAPASVSTGANLVVQPPAWLFATASATLLNLNLSSANAVHWGVSYWDEA